MRRIVCGGCLIFYNESRLAQAKVCRYYVKIGRHLTTNACANKHGERYRYSVVNVAAHESCTHEQAEALIEKALEAAGT